MGFSEDGGLDWTTSSFYLTLLLPYFSYVARKDEYEGERVAVEC